jgi:hypothetical protein
LLIVREGKKIDGKSDDQDGDNIFETRVKFQIRKFQNGFLFLILVILFDCPQENKKVKTPNAIEILKR